MESILFTASDREKNEDRGSVSYNLAGVVLVVADGAGGRSGASEAADMAIDVVHQNLEFLVDAPACVSVLEQADREIAANSLAGETTCTLAIVTQDCVFGASVGDSGAWIFQNSEVLDLTMHQSRKPFIGSGSAWATSFVHPRPMSGVLLLATDGLLKYLSRDQIQEVCLHRNIREAGQTLIDRVRYASGALPDDATVILTYL